MLRIFKKYIKKHLSDYQENLIHKNIIFLMTSQI